MQKTIVKLRILITSSLLLLTLFACNNSSTPVESKVAPVDTIESIQWSELTEAQELAKQQGKDIFMFVHAPWCPKCEAFDQGVFKDAQLVENINKHFISVRFNVQQSKDVVLNGKTYGNPNFDETLSYKQKNSYHELPAELGAKGIPNVLVLDQSLNLLSSVPGLREASTLNFMLGNASGRYTHTIKR